MRTLLKIVGVAAAVLLPAGMASAEGLYGLTAGNRIVTFDSTNPSVTITNRPITGLLAGEVLTGIDLRPANNTLYSVSTFGTLYSITRSPSGQSFVATVVGDLNTGPDGMPANTEVNLSGNRFGIDFNPTVDRLRFITDFDQNLRINPNNAVTIVDTPIQNPTGDQRSLVGAAYTNSFAGANSTMLYALDATGNQLQLSSSPNAGVYSAIGVVSGNLGGLNVVGFDISGTTGAAFFNNAGTLFSLNLANAQATSLGAIGAGSLIGLTAVGAVPEPSTWAMMIGGMGLVGGVMRRRRQTSLSIA